MGWVRLDRARRGVTRESKMGESKRSETTKNKAGLHCRIHVVTYMYMYTHTLLLSAVDSTKYVWWYHTQKLVYVIETLQISNNPTYK